MNDKPLKVLLTKQEVAYAIGRSIRYVDNLKKAGDLNAVYDGRDVRFTLDEVKRYANSLPSTPPS